MPSPSTPSTLAAFAVGVTAERRADQQLRFLVTRGATVHHVPVLRTIDHTERPEVVAAGLAMIDQPPDVLVVQTGQGLRWWLAAIGEERAPALISALRRSDIWCRGIKASSACRGAGLDVAWQAPGESTADVIAHLEETDLSSLSVAIQMDGNSDRSLVEAASEAADIVSLDVYCYLLPDDLDPAIALIDAVIAGRMHAVTFTASPAIRHLREIAAAVDLGSALDAAFNKHCIAAVVGPVCAATAREAGWTNIIEPERARLMPMLETLESALTL